MEYDGLNLTFATLEGVLKHSFPYEKAFIPNWIEESFVLNRHPSLEAMIVDHADAIAYTSHDIDDGIKYGLIDFEDLMKAELATEIDNKIKDSGLEKKEYIYRHRFVAGLIKLLVEDFIKYSTPKIRLYRDRGPLCATIPSDKPLPVGFSPKRGRQLAQLKEILLNKLYKHQKIVSKMHAGKECIRALYRAFNEDTDLLPERQKELLEKRNPKRVVADYIASMTDRYALKSYHEIYGISLK
jgi:dGTPase